jgi:hypothetical protein
MNKYFVYYDGLPQHKEPLKLKDALDLQRRTFHVHYIDSKRTLIVLAQ